MKEQKTGSTECVHAGAAPCDTSDSIITPIVHCAPFAFDSTQSVIDFFEGRVSRTQPEYGRMGNPTVLSAERRLAALEGAERAQLFGSGMTAVIAAFLVYLKSGDHLTITSDSYKRTRTFSQEFLTKYGVEVSVVPPTVEAIAAAVRPNTKLIFTETPSNPYLYVVDVEALASLGREKGILTIVDSTFATPLNLRPLDFGIDLVAHSATKYLGGHNDLIAGVLAGREEVLQPVSDFLMTLGGICGPQTAFLLERGLKTLSLRMDRHNANGVAVSEFLESHPKVTNVFYPGLPSHPHHEIAKRLMTGFSGVVSFRVDGNCEGTSRFVDRLQIPKLAPSLGGVESLVEQVAVMAYYGASREELESAGVTDNLVRLSIGIEDADDIIADLEQALGAL